MSKDYFDALDYHPTAEKIANLLAVKTQNTESRLYFRVLTAYYLCQMAGSMHVVINSKDRGKLPINMYALALAPSGFGKGMSKNIMEESIVNQFKERFLQLTFPEVAEQSILDAATQKSLLSSGNIDVDDAQDDLKKEFFSYGNMPYSFDSGTAAAFKEIRTKAQIARIGALNLEIDEIGTNLYANSELLGVFLEAYDKGLIKQKIIKNTSENKRAEERNYPIPTNMLMFGTPSKLFNGAREENEFNAWLDTGYARRPLFALGMKVEVSKRMDAKTRFQVLTSAQDEEDMRVLSNYFGRLADASNYQKEIQISDALSIELIEYQIDCELRSEALPEHESLLKAELEHRYFKALKLAGAYAFIDNSSEISESQLYNAIKVTEESGRAFEAILNRDKNYVKLAKYLAEVTHEVTHADLTEDLPFYRGNMSVKQDMMQLAAAWGYKNNIIVKRYFSEGIEFLKGESLQKTDLNDMIFSCSRDIAFNYEPYKKPFAQLHMMTQAQGIHWINHHVKNQHRNEENCLPEFNMIVLDCDGTIPLDTAQLLLKEYTALYYTTKRHTADKHRFRIIIPIAYHLRLQAADYKEFMANIYEWIPFSVDAATGQRSKKWLSHNGQYQYVYGQLLNPMQFIPKTSKNEARKKQCQGMTNASKTEAWFAARMDDGNRNNTLLKYALMLLDSGMDVDDIQTQVLDFNSRLANSLPVPEIMSTVMKTVNSKAVKLQTV